MTSQVSNDDPISVVCTSSIYTVLISAIFNLVRFMILHTYTRSWAHLVWKML